MDKTACKRQFAKTISFLYLLFQTTAVLGHECSASSTEKRAALLELYTSEGCSSCPPADRWLSRLAGGKPMPALLVPLAFHVDYWNDLGWTDPYSQAKFSQRQREYSRRRGAGFVVTPQLLLDGQNYQRPLMFDDIESKTKVINQSPPQADIRIRQTRTATRIDAQLQVWVPDAQSRHSHAYVALYENNLLTAVKAGENKGAFLKHDFVVRELGGPVALDATGNATQAFSFPIPADWKPRDLHLAAFVQNSRTGEVLQALLAPCQ